MDLRSPFTAFLAARPAHVRKADAERHQRAHLAGTVENLARQKADGTPVPYGYRLLPENRICRCIGLYAFGGRHYCCNFHPGRAHDVAQLGGSVDVSALVADAHEVSSPSVAQDSDRGTVHAANEAVSETKRHDG